MRKRIYAFPILIFLLAQIQLPAQLLPIFTQYREYAGYLNPASVSTDLFSMGNPEERYFKFGGGQRLQWIANDNFTVSTSIINGEAFVNLGAVSLLGGGYFIHDQVDVTAMDGFYGRFAALVGDPRGSFWGGLGFSAGYVLHAIDLRKLRSYSTNDPLLDYAKLTASAPDLSVGAFGVYNFGDYDKFLLFGVSIPQLLEPELNFTDDVTYNYTRFRHIFAHASFIATTSRDYGFFEVSLWGKIVEGLEPNIDLNLRYQVSSPFWIGLGVSSNGTAHIEAGTNISVSASSGYDTSDNFIKLGYALDFPFSPQYSTYFGTSHEINLSFVIF